MTYEHNYEFITARFVNDERTHIEATWVDDNGTTHADVCEAKEGEYTYDKVLQQMTIDQLHENTYKYIKQSQLDFEDQVLEIGKERGLIVDLSDELKSKASTLVAKFLFDDIEDDKYGKKTKERLFAFKLSVFENDSIRKSENKQLKSKIRKAESIEEVVKYSYEILKS